MKLLFDYAAFGRVVAALIKKNDEGDGLLENDHAFNMIAELGYAMGLVVLP